MSSSVKVSPRTQEIEWIGNTKLAQMSAGRRGAGIQHAKERSRSRISNPMHPCLWKSLWSNSGLAMLA